MEKSENAEEEFIEMNEKFMEKYRTRLQDC